MKKRILSFLLVLCMLAALFPVSAQAAEAENAESESTETAEALDSFLDLYYKTGLEALFVAYGDQKALYEISAEALLEQPNPYPESRPSLRAAYDAYKADFLAYAAYLSALENNENVAPVADPTATEYTDLIGAATMANGKIYLPASLVGGFDEYVENRVAGLAEGEFDEATTYRTVLEDVGVLMHIVAQWDYNIMHIVGIDYDDVIVDGDGEEHYACYMKLEEYQYYVIPGSYRFAGRPVYLTDSLDFMDEEGEFYYDEVNGTVYYYTEGKITDHTFAYPTMDNLLVLDGIKNTTLWGLRFTGVDDYFLTANGHAGCQSANDTRVKDFPTRAAIYVKNGCDNLMINSCVIEHVGCEGITMRGRIENLQVIYNTIYNTGSSGLRVANTTSDWNDTCGLDNVTISENYLEEIAYVYRNASAVHLGSSRNLVLSNNTIHDCSYTAISIGWRWSQVAWSGEVIGTGTYVNLYNVDIFGNYIYDYMTEMADGGAIYMLGGNAINSYPELFNYLHDNYIVLTSDSGNGLGGMICGIYFDGSSSNWHCYNNVVVEQSAGADIPDTPLFMRRRGTTYIYIQHIDSQITYNVLCENNIILNVRYKPEDGDYNMVTTKQEYEVYKTYVIAERNIKEIGTRYINGVTNLPAAVDAIISAAGCWQENGDSSLLAGNDY